MKNKRIHYAWLIFISCCAISFVGLGLVLSTQGLFFAPICKELYFTRGQISLMVTFQNIAGMIATPIAGRILPKFNSKLVLSMSLISLASSVMVCSTFHSLHMFYVAGIILGISQAFCINLIIPVFIGNWFEKKLGLALGIAAALSGVGGTIFNPLISSIIVSHGWRYAYVVIGIITLVVALPFTMFVIEFKPEDRGLLPYGADNKAEVSLNSDTEQYGITAKEAYRGIPFYLFCAALFSLQMIGGFIQHISSHVVTEGYPLTVGAAVVSSIMLGAAVGNFSVGFLLDKMSSKLVVIIYGIVGSIGCLGLKVAVNSITMILAGFAMGAGLALMLVPIPFMVKKVFGTKEFSEIYSTMSVVGLFAAAVSVYTGGAIFDVTKSYRIPILMNSGYYILTVIVSISALVIGSKIYKLNAAE